MGTLEVVHRREPGQQEDGDLGPGGLVGRGGDQVELVDKAEAVVEAGAAEAVTVTHLDDLHARPVQGVDHGPHLLLGELVAHRVRAVAQRGVGDPQVRRAAAGRRVLEDVALGDVLGDHGDVLGTDDHVAHDGQTPAFWVDPMSGAACSPSSVEDFHDASTPRRWASMRSPTRAAAAVMMSRLPA